MEDWERVCRAGQGWAGVRVRARQAGGALLEHAQDLGLYFLSMLWGKKSFCFYTLWFFHSLDPIYWHLVSGIGLGGKDVLVNEINSSFMKCSF